MSATSLPHSPSPTCTSADCRRRRGGKRAHQPTAVVKCFGVGQFGAVKTYTVQARAGTIGGAPAHHHCLPVLGLDPNHETKIKVAQPPIRLRGKEGGSTQSGQPVPGIANSHRHAMLGRGAVAAAALYQPDLAQQEVAAVWVAMHHARHQQLRQRALHAHAHEAQHLAPRLPLPLILCRAAGCAGTVKRQRLIYRGQQLGRALSIHPLCHQHAPRGVPPHDARHCRGRQAG